MAVGLLGTKPLNTERIIPDVNMTFWKITVAETAGHKDKASRYACGSARRAEVKNTLPVAEEMGESPATANKHYFQAVTKAEASRFWKIRPASLSPGKPPEDMRDMPQVQAGPTQQKASIGGGVFSPVSSIDQIPELASLS